MSEYKRSDFFTNSSERRVRARPLWQQTIGKLIEDIRAGRLRSGQRIIEAQLQRELGVSRNPIREAIRQLEQRNILVYEPNIGTVVAGFSREDANIIVENRIFLEQKAVQLIFAHKRLENLILIEHIIKDMSALSGRGSVQSFERLDFEFHYGLVRAADNEILRRLWKTLDPTTKMIMYMWEIRRENFSEEWKIEFESHRDLLELIRTSTPAKAQSAVANHVMHSWRTIVEGPET